MATNEVVGVAIAILVVFALIGAVIGYRSGNSTVFILFLIFGAVAAIIWGLIARASGL